MLRTMKPILKNPKVLTKLIFQMIEEHIEDFLAYLDINRSMFFSSEKIFLKSLDDVKQHLQAKTTKVLPRIICFVAEQRSKATLQDCDGQ